MAALGVAIPGLVNRQTDRVVDPRDLPSTMVEDLHGGLTRATGLRVEIENDANAAAYGEFKVGAGRGSRNLFYMMIGNGIGGAIILDGKLWTGASGSRVKSVTSRSTPKDSNAFAVIAAAWKRSHPRPASCAARANG